MKREAYILLTFLFIFLLISHPTFSARILQNDDQGSVSSMANMEEDDFATLMGFEECKENEEDCIKRRMMADAHLDYIYTQHHKPSGSP